MQNKKIILNLGCGKTRIPDSIGVDKMKLDDYVDVIHDLDITPYPFPDNFADEVHLYHTLEHLHDPIKKIEEVHRILKPGGLLYVRVPHFSCFGAFADITHIRPFGYTSFDYFEENQMYDYYSKAKFKIMFREIKYFGLYPNTGLYEKYIHKNSCIWFAKPFVLAINFLIRLSPVFFERIWCYWVGGAMEINFVLKKI